MAWMIYSTTFPKAFAVKNYDAILKIWGQGHPTENGNTFQNSSSTFLAFPSNKMHSNLII